VVQRYANPNRTFGLTKHKPVTMVRAVDRVAMPPRTPEEYLDERISRTDPGDRCHRASWIQPADCTQLSRLINRTPVSLREFVRANRAVL
jgi:hypothetical protein